MTSNGNYVVSAAAKRKLIREQNGLCAACKESFDVLKDGRTTSHVDHDHSCCPGRISCGKCVRGVLCYRCNIALGMLGNDPDKILALFDYLEDSKVAL